VVSDIPIFREIGGEAARFFDPDDISELVRQVRSLEDPAQWLDASARSLQAAARYTWADSARHLLTVLTATVGRAEREERRVRRRLR
jgi:hypothetical protein